MHRLIAAAALSLASLAPLAASAATLGLDLVRPPVVTVNGAGFVVGYRFLVNAPIDVVALGAYDRGGDGIVTGAAVGLYDLAGTALATAVIPEGADAGRLVGDFRFATILATRVMAGTEYVLGSYSEDPNGFFNANYGAVGGGVVQLAAAPEITLQRNRDLSSIVAGGPVTGLAFPSRESTFNVHLGSFGPNLLFEAVSDATPIPLPAALPLLLAGVAGLGGLRLARRRPA